MDRREFIKSTGAGIAASVGCSCAPALADGEGESSLLNVIWDKAPCRYCGTGCGVEVAVRDNKVVAVRGDEKSPVNQGLLCAKGYHLPSMLYGSKIV